MNRVEIECKGIASDAAASRGIRAVAAIPFTILSSQGDLGPVRISVCYRIHVRFKFIMKQLMWKLRSALFRGERNGIAIVIHFSVSLLQNSFYKMFRNY